MSPQPEFSRLINVEKMQAQKTSQHIEATSQECMALKDRFQIQQIGNIAADLDIEKVNEAGEFKVTGSATADVLQLCVVSLDPIKSHIKTEFEAFFSTTAPIEDPEDILEKPFDPLEKWLEPVIDGHIDMGELVAQEIALQIAPYPRKEGVSLGDEYTPEPAPQSPDQPTWKPFTALSGILKKQDKP